MRIDIHSKKIELDELLRTHIERRLGCAIGRFNEFIRCVTVELGGRNGNHAKRCRVRVLLRPTGDAAVEEAGVDLYDVTTRAAGRIGLAVYGELYRMHNSRRSAAG